MHVPGEHSGARSGAFVAAGLASGEKEEFSQVCGCLACVLPALRHSGGSGSPNRQGLHARLQQRGEQPVSDLFAASYNLSYLRRHIPRQYGYLVLEGASSGLSVQRLESVSPGTDHHQADYEHQNNDPDLPYSDRLDLPVCDHPCADRVGVRLSGCPVNV